MSRSFTVKPSVSQTSRGVGARGRGRGSTQTITRPAPPNRTRNMDPYSHESNAQNQTTSVNPQGNNPEDRIQRRDAYSMISPNEKKRQQILNQASKGEASYQKHLSQNRLGHVSYVGTVGGGEVSQNNARKVQQQQQNTSPFERSRLARERARKEEEKKLQEQKDLQRRKSDQNKLRDSARQRVHGAEMRQINSEFLDRLEQQSKQTQQQQRTQQVLSTSEARQIADEGPDVEQGQDDEERTGAVGGEGNLDTLIERFPSYDPDYLEGLLLQMNGNLAAVCDMLNCDS